MLDELDIVPLTDILGAGVFELVCVVVIVPLTDILGAGVFELVCDVVIVSLTDILGAGVFELVCDVVDVNNGEAVVDTLGTGVFELVCVVVDVNDCEELLDRVVEPLADDVGSVVLLRDSDADEEAVADELAVWLPDSELAALLTVADELPVPTCVIETVGLLETLMLPDSVIDASLEILWLTVTLLLPVTDELAVPDSVSLTDELLEASVDTDIDVESEELTDAVGWSVPVKLDVCDKLLEDDGSIDADAEVVIDMVADSDDEAVDDILVL